MFFPPISLRRVVLPAPFAPTSRQRVPRSIRKSTPFKAVPRAPGRCVTLHGRSRWHVTPRADHRQELGRELEKHTLNCAEKHAPALACLLRCYGELTRELSDRLAEFQLALVDVGDVRRPAIEACGVEVRGQTMSCQG
eukprot:scaffold266290_cov28-Tisochrysis_lutea.AAC.2